MGEVSATQGKRARSAGACGLPSLASRAELAQVTRRMAPTYCPQHITPRYTEEQVRAVVAPLRDQLAPLDAEQAALKARLAEAQGDGA